MQSFIQQKKIIKKKSFNVQTMALSSQGKTENLNENKNEPAHEHQVKNQGSIQNGTTESTSGTQGHNKIGIMSDPKTKSPNGNNSGGNVENSPAPYGEHVHLHGQPPSGPPDNHPLQGPPNPGKQDEPSGAATQHQQMHYGPPPPMHQQYPRYHHDPNMPPGDPYGHYRPFPPGGKPGTMGAPNRPPQRYMPGPPPPGHAQGPPGQQGPTPTLNSLLQSQPPPHRYPNFDPNQQPPQPQHPGPPQPQSGYSGQTGGWSQPQLPRPYSPQMGSQQAYRPPPVSIFCSYRFSSIEYC